jgi:outer membrane protein
VYSFALQNHPAMRSARASVRSAETGLEIARGNFYPSLSLSGSVGTNASSTRRLYSQQITGIDTIGLTLPSQELVVIPRFTLFAEDYPYGSQLRDNFNQTVSINLSIPIFNNRRVRNAVDQARINHQLVGLQMRQQENQLRDAVYRAYQSALAAARQYDAAQENALANRTSFEYISRRAEQGLVRTVDFNLAQNNLGIAESTLLQAKYQYVLSLKILDFYMGKPITLN